MTSPKEEGIPLADRAATSALPWAFLLPACSAEFGLANPYNSTRQFLKIILALDLDILLVLFLWRTLPTKDPSLPLSDVYYNTKRLREVETFAQGHTATKLSGKF